MGLKKYYEIEEETPYHIKGFDEANITLLVCYSFKKSRPILAAQIRPLRVDVYGEPRKSARTKDSQWVRSNFFAVLHNPDTRQPLVVTAPLHCVLEGTIMKMVVMICKRDGIDFRFWFPNIEDISQWKGAFITSTSRLVLPIEMMRFRDGRPMEKLSTDDETIVHIKNEVEKEILNRAFRIL
ncbi:10210_t:CDS:2 [Diversispora eburnea]|uniref:10210_t:CDS:1 n=1 Tax=Diversispora eburnea TaxID=1213867 RepID=A0A9N9FTW8_9GLOM|nr:10210_t:CDS:2 [Diversispora eburnea]